VSFVPQWSGLDFFILENGNINPADANLVCKTGRAGPSISVGKQARLKKISGSIFEELITCRLSLLVNSVHTKCGDKM